MKKNVFFPLHIRMSNPTIIANQIEESISEKNCISEMAMMIDRYIKGLESLNVSLNELRITTSITRSFHIFVL